MRLLASRVLARRLRRGCGQTSGSKDGGTFREGCFAKQSLQIGEWGIPEGTTIPVAALHCCTQLLASRNASMAAIRVALSPELQGLASSVLSPAKNETKTRVASFPSAVPAAHISFSSSSSSARRAESAGFGPSSLGEWHSQRLHACGSTAADASRDEAADRSAETKGLNDDQNLFPESSPGQSAEVSDEAQSEPTSNASGAAASGESSGDSNLAGSLGRPEEDEGRRRVRAVERRVRGRGEGRELLAVPGIGVRNMEKLKAAGIAEVAGLTQLYRDKFLPVGETKMVEYLRSKIGILSHHATLITAFVKHKVEQEMGVDGSSLAEDAAAGGGDASGSAKGRRRSDRLTFCVEGNISVGKSTFLRRIAEETVLLHDLVEMVPEPIEKWQDAGPGRANILQAFYEEPERYAYTFQNYVFVTLVMQERESAEGVRPLRLMERSIYSNKHVFVRSMHEAKLMSDLEVSVYDSWFDPILSALPGLVPDGFIYLRANPETCHQRLQLRGRGEEAGVSLAYLQGLHEKHEQWLMPVSREVVSGSGSSRRSGSSGGSGGLLAVGEWQSGLREQPPEIIASRVCGLGGSHVHPSIQEVPALILDCDINIDFNRDVDIKDHFAAQVKAFYDYVKKVKKSEEEERTKVGVEPQSPIIIPRTPSLALPKGLSFDTKQLLQRC